MLTTSQLFDQLNASGILVTLHEGRLRVRGPEGSLTPEWRQLLRDRRNEILHWLQVSTPSTSQPPMVERVPTHPASPALARVTNAETFLAVVAALERELRTHPGRVAIDLETTGLDARLHKVVSIALGVPGRVTILDLRPYYTRPVAEQVRWSEALRALIAYGGTTWVGQNLKFDWQFLAAHFDAHLDTVYDTMLVEQILHGMKQERGHTGFKLQEIASRYDIAVSKEERQWFVDLDTRPDEWAAPFPDQELRYMVQDIEVPYRIAGMQQEVLERHQLLGIADLEHFCVPALAAMELHGVLIDQEQWRHALQRKEARRDALAATLMETLGKALETARVALGAEEKRLMQVYTTDEQIRCASSWDAFRAQSLQAWASSHPAPPKPHVAGQSINLGSSSQVITALAQLGIVVTSTKEEVLEEYAGAHPIVAELLAWRKLDHFCNAFGENLLEHIQADSRIHAHFAQVGAVSGRIICSKPNLQQIPKKREQEAEEEDIRRCFIAPPGSLLIKSDLSNIELRILAEVAHDETMLRFFAEGRDLHAETAKLMFRLPPDTNTKQHLYQGVVVRDIAKTINYGLSYGMGAQSLADRVNVSVEEARGLMKTYFQTYPGVDRWLRQAAQQAHRQGYAASCAGRKRFFSFNGVSRGERASLERMSRNHPIQATNADILKRAMSYLYDVLPAGAHLVLAVHDEIVLECPEPLVEEATLMLKTALVAACRADLKLVHIPEPEVLVAPYWKKG